MTLLSVAERARVWRLLAHTAWQSILRWVHGGPLFRWRPFAGAPARLLIAPQDLRTADGTNAADIYAGRFVFAGQQIEANGRSPFEVEPPSRRRCVARGRRTSIVALPQQAHHRKVRP